MTAKIAKAMNVICRYTYIIFVLFLMGCATSPVGQSDAAFVEYLADFQVKGVVTEFGSDEPLREADIIFVDIDLGSPDRARKLLGTSDNNGRFDFSFSYWWCESVVVPPPHDLGDEEFQLRLFGQLSSRPNYLEVWIMKDGYQSERSTFDFNQMSKKNQLPLEQSPSLDDWPLESSPRYIVDLEVVRLEKS